MSNLTEINKYQIKEDFNKCDYKLTKSHFQNKPKFMTVAEECENFQ